MSKLNMDYGLRDPSHAEIRETFGSLAACVRVTGGDAPTILFYLNNPDRIEGAGYVAPQPGFYAKALQESARIEEAARLWDEAEKPTIKAIASAIGCDRSLAKRALEQAGKWPIPVPPLAVPA